MNLNNSLIWMFIGSIIIGLFLNGMNILAFRYSDLYLSYTLIYSASLMASLMCIVEILMYYHHSGKFSMTMFLLFLTFSIICIFLLRNQFLINDNQWLKRMISHHSTALTTSHKIKERTKNDKVKKLASEIIETQEREIKLMKSLLQ